MTGKKDITIVGGLMTQTIEIQKRMIIDFYDNQAMVLKELENRDIKLWKSIDELAQQSQLILRLLSETIKTNEKH